MSFDWASELFIDPARGKDDNQIIYTLNHTLLEIFTHPETGLRESVCVGPRIFKNSRPRPSQISKQIIVGVFMFNKTNFYQKPRNHVQNVRTHVGLLKTIFESKSLTVKVDGPFGLNRMAQTV